jgi:peptidoglycan/LPS O-acetylase OafA/YrhL
MEYRKDIDGLRAIAVVPVIFFHAGFEVFNGGFLGVDIFFVISGFLITSILISELETNKFSIVNFYERRARRILPALFVVLFTTYLASFIFMPPYEFKEFSQSLVSVAVFLSNMFFYLEIDYFSLAAEEMPLLHTWSLAIEEQYYILFPPLLFVIWKLDPKKVLLALTLIGGMSFISMIYLNELGNNSASFYWLFSRAWELLAGSTCALLIRFIKLQKIKYVSSIGLLILLSSLFFWSKDIIHPGYLTIIPVLATCLIILFPDQESFSYKFLTNPIFLFLGLISYSLYLWHQPIFAFLRMKTIGHPSEILFTIAIIVTFIASILSYRYVETPFRNKSKYSRKYILLSSTLLLILTCLIGLIGHFNEGIPSRFLDLKVYSESIQHSPKRQACHSTQYNYISPEESCTYFEDNISWAVLGDSHIVEPAYALASLLKERGVGLRHHSFTGCHPLLTHTTKKAKLCTNWLNESLTYLENNIQVENVLLGFRYSGGIYGDNIKTFPDIPTQVVMKFDTEKEFTEEQTLDLYWASLREIIERLLKSGKRVLILEPIPELPIHISKGTAPFSIYGQSTLLDLTTSTSKEYYEQRHKFILDKLRSMKEVDNLILINVYELLCHDLGCPAVIGDNAIYFDDDHLSIEGSRILFSRLASKMVL